VVGRSAKVTSKISLDIGSVRLTERFLKSSPPSLAGLVQAQQFIKDHLRSLHKPVDDSRCIGVAGTLTTLAAIDLQLSVYDRERVSGHVLTSKFIEEIFKVLKGKRLEELKSIPQILPERADIILAGVMILMEILKRLNIQSVIASDRGLRYGLFLRAAKRMAK